MKEYSIIFSGLLIPAVLDFRKTMTRRVIKPQPRPPNGICRIVPHSLEAGGFGFFDENRDYRCPYGEPGDRLYVKERWRYYDWTEDGDPWIEYADGTTKLCAAIDDEWREKTNNIWADLSDSENMLINGRAADQKWRSPRFMPKWAARIWLENTGVCGERLQDISEEDAISEGIRGNEHEWVNYVYPENGRCFSSVTSFASLWDNIYGIGAWDKNDWVWVIEFKRIEP